MPLLRDEGRQWPALELRAGALPFRHCGQDIELLLIRRTGSPFWSIPKGHLSAGRQPWETAANEAMEEAGASGRICTERLGSYVHVKTPKHASGFAEPVEVLLFPLEVERLDERWLEMASRERCWFGRDEAMGLVVQSKLRDLVADFQPSRLLVA
jgi:8-oxo-dGTP pyrophosphatase MutT (NUDIX family)